MEIEQSGIHRIARNTVDAQVTIETAEHNAIIPDEDTALFSQLSNALQTHNQKQYGVFQPEDSGLSLAPCLTAYKNEELNFHDFSATIAKQAKRNLESIEEQFEFYLWVVEAQSFKKVVYVFWLQHDQAHHISRHLAVTSVYCISPMKLQFATSIDLAQWRHSDSKKYLSYLAPKGERPESLAFQSFIGFEQSIDRAQEAESMLESIERFGSSMSADKEHDYKAKVLDFCMEQSKQGEAVEMEALSAFVDEKSPQAFKQFINEGMEAPLLEWNPDYNSLRRYSRFCGRDQHLSISFSSAMFGREIMYDEASETLTIRAVPNSLKKQLQRAGK